MPRLWLAGLRCEVWRVVMLLMARFAFCSTTVGSTSRSGGGVSHLVETRTVGREAFVIASARYRSLARRVAFESGSFRSQEYDMI